MRLLKRLWNDIACREVVVLAVEFPTLLGKHRNDGLDRLFPAIALVAYADAERMQLRGSGALPHAQFNAAAGDLIERGDAFCHSMRLVGGDLNNAMTQPDSFRALAGGSEKHLGC